VGKLIHHDFRAAFDMSIKSWVLSSYTVTPLIQQSWSQGRDASWGRDPQRAREFVDPRAIIYHKDPRGDLMVQKRDVSDIVEMPRKNEDQIREELARRQAEAARTMEEAKAKMADLAPLKTVSSSLPKTAPEGQQAAPPLPKEILEAKPPTPYKRGPGRPRKLTPVDMPSAQRSSKTSEHRVPEPLR
jgi:hypothetical protein